MTFDHPSDARVRALWADLADPGLLTPHIGRPHMTFAQVAPEDVEAAGAALADIAHGVHGLRVAIDSLGVFPGEQPVLFLNPVPSGRLLALHRRIHLALQNGGIEHDGPFQRYVPGEWVPHVTLGRLKDETRLGDALAIANGFRLRFELTGVALGSFHSPLR
ncbi:MAG: 2'-5' RNA ligase family protein [Thermomicrobiales bacterium]